MTYLPFTCGFYAHRNRLPPTISCNIWPNRAAHVVGISFSAFLPLRPSPTLKVDLNLAGMSVVTAHSEAHGESHRPKSAPRLAVKLRTSSHNGLGTLLKGVYSYHTPCKQAGEGHALWHLKFINWWNQIIHFSCWILAVIIIVFSIFHSVVPCFWFAFSFWEEDAVYVFDPTTIFIDNPNLFCFLPTFHLSLFVSHYPPPPPPRDIKKSGGWSFTFPIRKKPQN